MSSEDRCGTCGVALDLRRYARCDVCDGARLCVRMVRGGVADARFGVSE